MSNAQEHHSDEHQAVIKTPKQLITVVVLAFIVPIVIIIMLVNYVANQTKVGAGSEALTTAAIDARIAPVAGFELVDASAPREFLTGDAVYQQVCAACHTNGVAGAPKSGDATAWAPRLATGFDALVASTINGKGAMPPKGGAANLSDYEIARAVVYMANQAGGTFEEPAAPAAEGETMAEAEAQAPVAVAETPAPAAAPAPAPAAPAPTPEPAPAAVATAEPAPVAEVAPAAPAIQISADAATVGKQLYDQVCMACHAAGVAGAPKLGVLADWEPYFPEGIEGMLQVVIKGKGAMPPKGGAANASTEQLRLAVEYMVSSVL